MNAPVSQMPMAPLIRLPKTATAPAMVAIPAPSQRIKPPLGKHPSLFRWLAAPMALVGLGLVAVVWTAAPTALVSSPLTAPTQVYEPTGSGDTSRVPVPPRPAFTPDLPPPPPAPVQDVLAGASVDSATVDPDSRGYDGDLGLFVTAAVNNPTGGDVRLVCHFRDANGQLIKAGDMRYCDKSGSASITVGVPRASGLSTMRAFLPITALPLPVGDNRITMSLDLADESGRTIPGASPAEFTLHRSNLQITRVTFLSGQTRRMAVLVRVIDHRVGIQAELTARFRNDRPGYGANPLTLTAVAVRSPFNVLPGMGVYYDEVYISIPPNVKPDSMADLALTEAHTRATLAPTIAVRMP